MTTNEANKICAEFMGCDFNATETCIVDKDHNLSHLYSKSLDSLVPIWEKMSNTSFQFYILGGDFTFKTPFSKSSSKEVDTPQEAACIATAKAIKELKK